MAKVVLEFEVDVSEEEAWGIAEGLEAAARARNYRAVNGFVVSETIGRPLGSAENPVSSSAESVEAQRGQKAMMFGGEDTGHMLTLGGDDGRRG